jgi:pilus assembly protein FimV
MAFGFGFNKQKVLSAAEKYVQQGKLQNAISEYEKILKADAKDLTVLNTVGDLYARIGEVDKATECFKSVGDAYATQGFTVKGIAMYKKIAKLKPSLESVLKLAELYTQQGLFNDARAQYLQVAEEFLRAGELEQSVRIFQKILEMDPENVAMRVRLAEVYIRLGKKTDAWQIFSAAAETLRGRGSRSGAEEILQRMLTLDPGNSYALLLRGRNALESGDAAAAIKFFEKVVDIDNHPDGVRDLLKAYLQAGRVAEAGSLANKLLSDHNDVEAMFSYINALVQAGGQEEALQVIDLQADRLLADNSAKVLETLRALIGPLGGNASALETLLELFHKAGDQSQINEVSELLAHACVQSGDLVKARDLYKGLAEQEPQNAMHMQNYQQVVGMMGGSSSGKLLTVEEGIVLVEELEATAPPVDQQYSPEVANALRAALTDTELFVSYNMPDKALGPLMAVLPIAPSDVRLNQRLAALYTRSQRFGDAAACCRTLATVYSEADLQEEAARYDDLAKRCQERASASPAATHVETVVEEETAAAPWPVTHGAEFPREPEVQSREFAAQADADTVEIVEADADAAEIDLSAEWDGAITTDAVAEETAVVKSVPDEPAVTEVSAETSDAVAETIEEIRFYLDHSMADQARAAFSKLQTLTAENAQIAALRAEISAAGADPTPSIETEPEEVRAAAVEEMEVAPAADIVEPEFHARPEEASPIRQMVADLDASLGDGFLPDTVTHHEVEHAPEVVAHANSEPALVSHLEFMAGPKLETKKPLAEESAGGVLGEFVADLEESLGDGFLKDAPVADTAQAAAAQSHAEPAPVEPKRHMAASAVSGAGSAPATVVPSEPVAASPRAVASAAAAQPVPAPATFRVSARPTSGTSPSVKPDAAASVDLADMFGEIRHELEEEVSAAEEDPETHYNLGVAFREMGLLDEAIGELQKVCQAIDQGHPFPQVMQTYTWLAQCFLDKGVPQAAIRWYEQALKLPTLDQETRTALHYELASSYEAAGDKSTSLRHFMEVYGSNIDYRDVGERIKALKS